MIAFDVFLGGFLVLFAVAAAMFIISMIAFAVFSEICDSKGVPNPVAKFHERLKNRNRLYKCDRSNCEKLYRYYQSELYDHRYRELCPHCKQKSEGCYTTKIRHPDPWMDTNRDCLKINLREGIKFAQTVAKMEKLRKQTKILERFEEYNQLSVDLKWIENIQKKKRD